MRDISKIVIIYILVVFTKSIFSLKMQTPWLLTDEMDYITMAKNIANSEYFWLPRGYPVILSISLLLIKDAPVYYHIMLITNSIISATIIFPSFFILNKYCSRDYSILCSAAIATLPSLSLYSLLILTENLFVPLFIFTIWFIGNAFETKKQIWIFLTIFSIFMLFFTRSSGLAMICSLLLSFIYYLKFIDKIEFKTKHCISWISIMALVLLTTTIYYIFLSKISFLGYFDTINELLRLHFRSFLTIFNTISNFENFSLILIREIDYLILTSYFIIFIIFVLFVVAIFKFPGYIKNISLNLFEVTGFQKRISLKISLLYFIISAFLLFITTVLTMYSGIAPFPILGRYLDPITPGIFLFGFIGLYHLNESKSDTTFKTVSVIAITSLAIILISFPGAVTRNAITIYYIQYLIELYPLVLIISSILLLFMAIFYFYVKNKLLSPIFVVGIILFSIFNSSVSLQSDVYYMSNLYMGQNQIGTYLSNSSLENATILMDYNDFDRDQVMWSLTKFWAKGSIVTYFDESDDSGVYTPYAKNSSYIISSKELPYPILAISTRGYYLYKTDPSRSYIWGIKMNDGWQNLEIQNNHTSRWMGNSANITIYSNKNTTEMLAANVSSFHHPRTLEISGSEFNPLSINISLDAAEIKIPLNLTKGFKVLQLKTREGCEMPRNIPELNSSDERCLSLRFQDVKLYPK